MRNGKAYGLATSLSMLGSAIGPTVGGTLAMQAGLRVPFLVTGTAMETEKDQTT